MKTTFTPESTTEDVLAGIDLTGKRVLITGVSAGIGVETARALTAHGATVVGTARDLDKAMRATEHFRHEVGERLRFVEMDLASLASVRTAADQILADGTPFDIIIANAGVMATPFGRTQDGFETQFGTNHLGHFLFVNRVAPLLQSPGRLINLASSGHRFSNVDLDDPNFETTPYDPFVAYGRSKTANVLFSVEFDRRYRDRGIRAAAVHPGGINTELGRHMPKEFFDGMVEQLNAELAAEGKGPFKLKEVETGAATSVWAAVVADANEVGGQYCENCHVGTIVPNDQVISAISEGVRSYALDDATARALWAKSEEMVGERF